MSAKVTLQRKNATAEEHVAGDHADAAHPNQCNDTVPEQRKHLEEDRSDRRLSNEDSSKLSMNDSDSMFLPPSAMADLLEDDFLIPIAKSTQIQPETPSEGKNQPAPDGNPCLGANKDNCFISPPEGVTGDNLQSNNLADISPSDQAKVRSPDLLNAYASLSRGNPLKVVDCRKQLEDELSLERNQQLTSNLAGGTVSRLNEGTTDSRTDSTRSVTEGISAVDWSRGHAVRSDSGLAQVNMTSFLNVDVFLILWKILVFTTPLMPGFWILTPARILEAGSPVRVGISIYHIHLLHNIMSVELKFTDLVSFLYR